MLIVDRFIETGSAKFFQVLAFGEDISLTLISYFMFESLYLHVKKKMLQT